MRTFFAFTIAVVFATIGVAAQQAQSGRGGTPAAASPSPPSPPRDLTGVWMMRNPPGSNRGFTNYTDYRHRVNVHRAVAIGSFALSTVGGVMMWFWKQ